MHPAVVRSLMRLKAYHKMFTGNLQQDIETPAVCFTRAPERLPDVNIILSPPRLEPSHRPGLVLHAIEQNEFRTFPDIITMSHISSWHSYASARYARFINAPDDVLERLRLRGIHKQSSNISTAYDWACRERPRVCFIVDTYEWAWHIATRSALYYWPEVCGDIVDSFIARFISPKAYDFTFVFPWANRDIMKRLDPDRTAIFVAGGHQLTSYLPSFQDVMKRFRIVCCRNKQLKQAVEEMFPKSEVYLVSNGVDTEHFCPSAAPEVFTVGWVGRVNAAVKRFHLAQMIAKRAKVPLKVASFENRIPHELMPDFYHDCSLLLVTSETEAHPLPVFEALSCGVPVITTDVGDVREVISDGENGFIVPVDFGIDDVIEKINLLREDEQLYNTMRQNARESILQSWTWHEVIEQYREFARDHIPGYRRHPE